MRSVKVAAACSVEGLGVVLELEGETNLRAAGFCRRRCPGGFCRSALRALTRRQRSVARSLRRHGPPPRTLLVIDIIPQRAVVYTLVRRAGKNAVSIRPPVRQLTVEGWLRLRLRSQDNRHYMGNAEEIRKFFRSYSIVSPIQCVTNNSFLDS